MFALYATTSYPLFPNMFCYKTVVPFFVSTAMSAHARASFFIRTPISFTKAALATVGIQNTTFGCFPHAIQVRFPIH